MMRSSQVLAMSVLAVSCLQLGCDQAVQPQASQAPKPAQQGGGVVTSPGIGAGVRGARRNAEDTRDQVAKYQQDVLNEADRLEKE
jgi:hypothetical protein